MDRIWQDAPSPALLIEQRDGMQTVTPNVAALRWASRQSGGPPDWQALAAERMATLAGIQVPGGATLVWLDVGVVPLDERGRLLAHALGVGFWTRDIDAGTAWWDEQMYRIHGRPPEAGPPGFDEWIDLYVHADDRARVTELHLRASAAWEPVVDAMFRATPRPGGEERWIQTWTRRTVRGRHRIAFGMHLDVTERERAQAATRHEQLRTQFAIDAADVGVWERGLDGRIRYWNDAMYRLRGLLPSDPRTPDAIAAETYHPDDRVIIREAFERHLRDGTPYRVEARARRPDGHWRWLVTQGRALRDGQGRVLGMAGINLDITERKQADELRLQKERAEQATRDKSAFLARLSHELRTPMNAVLGFTQLLAGDLDEPPSARQRQRLQQVMDAGDRMMALIDDLLELASLDSTAPPPADPLPLVEVLAQVQDMLGALARRSEVGLRITRACAGVTVRADRRRLAQALTHLASHAVRRQRPPAQVEIDAPPGAAPGEALVVVRDDGPAYSESERSELFEPLVRTARDGAAGLVGTGLGLNLAQALLRSLGGRVTSRPGEGGQGNEFVVHLPAAPPPPPAVAPPRLCVLCVEDDPVSLALVRELLGRRGDVRLLEATDGTQGLALARAHLPDLVLLDMHLPGLGGVELVRRLRADPLTHDRTCIALSADVQPASIQAARAAGFDDYWTKPIDMAAFMAAIDRYGASLSRTQAPPSAR